MKHDHHDHAHEGHSHGERSGERDHSGCAHDPARAHGTGVDLTPARRLVLDELCAAGGPVGAYEMIDRVAEKTGKRPAPIQIYRALDFLVENGLVHRLASRNAFMACDHGHDAHEPAIFLICDECGSVTEATSHEATQSLSAVAAKSGFATRAQVIELAGRCARCRQA
jgi:Fur family zinc uptake transcriptional regulator